jgi:hypothetical protein
MVGERHDIYHGGFIAINDGERKVVEDESACPAQPFRPALRRLGQTFETVVNSG